jgi:CubicO group peptidase (beta-lactamase class C family)
MIAFDTPFQPEEVGYDPSRLAVLEAHFERMMKAGRLQSANYRLSRDGKVFANRAVGKLSFRADDPRELRPDTVQRIASITKIFTSTAIFKLVEDGFIRPSQPVADFFTGIRHPALQLGYHSPSPYPHLRACAG